MRAFLCGVFIFTLCVLGASQSFADVDKAKAQAREALSSSVTKVMDYIKDPNYKDSKKRQEINKKIEKEIYFIFDFSEFAMRTAGQRWKSFSPEQQKAFSDAFADLLFSTYLDRLDGYNGEKIQYIDEVSNKSGSRVEVRSIVTLQDNKKVPVFYRMLIKNGKWCVYDVLIEGISLVKNYRSQFGDILAKDSPEDLIARIQERANALRKKINE